MRRRNFCLIFLALILSPCVALAGDPLPSWNCTGHKPQLIRFVQDAVNLNSEHYLPVSRRIAVFDGDGTLWPEQPVPIQLVFAMDELRRLAPEHPEWKDNRLIQLALNSELDELHEDLGPVLLELLNTTHTGITVEEFSLRVNRWMESAQHLRFERPYKELAYQPMLELLDYLRRHGFKTYLVASGGADFSRIWASEVCGFSPETIIGSTGNLRFEIRDEIPVLLKEPGIHFLDDYAGKPVAIHRRTGQKPVICVGNSDGDQAMLEWTTLDHSPSLGILVHHTDELREYDYDADPKHAAPLKTSLIEAEKHGWHVIDMQSEWQTIFADRPKLTP